MRPNLHVLVLDDEAAVRQAMQLLLGSHGCVVTLAASTREAVLKCMQLRPDILLTRICDWRALTTDSPPCARCATPCRACRPC
ncbi:hypothetical protein ACVBEH_06350 [Roseateles sp. GG27B]